ncbi:MAG: hypothetical protein FGM32_10870, partial [Candidatus Kapabacteria bacterium]|nr:hypothetical protein [Candidatus Kapabacteria bacterium]
MLSRFPLRFALGFGGNNNNRNSNQQSVISHQSSVISHQSSVINNLLMLILWDIDGTLLRTTQGIGREMYIRAFRSVLNTDVSAAVASMSFAGRTDRSLVHEIGAAVGHSTNDVEAAWPE